MKKISFLPILGIFLLCLLSACGTSATTNSPTPTPKPAADLIQSSTNVMKQLKSLHLSSNGVNKTTIGSTTSAATQKIDGDVALPDQGTFTYTSVAASQNTVIKEVIKDNKFYIQMKDKWYVIDSTSGDISVKSLESSIQKSEAANNLSLTKSAKLTDHGEENVAGMRLRHITAVLDKNALQNEIKTTFGAILQQMQTSQSSTQRQQQQTMDTLLNNIKIEKPTEDLWIDEATAYVHRIKLTYTMILDLSSMVTPTTTSSSTPSTITADSDVTNDYTNFNKAVTITAPQDAAPISSLADALK